MDNFRRIKKKILLEFEPIDRYGNLYKTPTIGEQLMKIYNKNIQQWIDEGTIELKDIID